MASLLIRLYQYIKFSNHELQELSQLTFVELMGDNIQEFGTLVIDTGVSRRLKHEFQSGVRD